ncbi:UNVERIFIED_CONTAM: Sucrose-6F-phosphate phosphohydrolase [Hammondia hammondi]|eukprot:XP_008889259.1 Sucrose-6F-phosphate phosphohydrolase [Hammondia hammondi]
MSATASVFAPPGASHAAPVLLQFYYQTGWRSAVLHFQQHLENGKLDWKDQTMESCAERGREDWQACELLLEPRVVCLEFVCCNGERTHWDNPGPGTCSPNTQNYMLHFCTSGKREESEIPDLMPTRARVSSRSVLGRERDTGAPTKASKENPEPLRRVIAVLASGQLAALDGPPCLLVSDLDGTFLGNDHYLWLLKKHWDLRHLWRGSQLVYNTGRNLKDFLSVAGEKQLPRPAYAILGVGTEIYSFPDSPSPLDAAEASEFQAEAAECEGLNWPAWCPSRTHAHFDETWKSRIEGQFDRRAVEREVKATMAGCHVNGNAFYDPYRLSVSVPLDLVHAALHTPPSTSDSETSPAVACQAQQNGTATEATAVAYLRSLIDSHSKKICVSGGGDWRYLDILPRAGGKLNASLFVMEQLGFKKARTIVAGDSGNDIDMFCDPEILGVCVRNAQPELLNFLQSFHGRRSSADAARAAGEAMLDELTNAQARHGRVTVDAHERDFLAPAHLRTLQPTMHVCFATHDCAGGILDGLLFFKFDKTIPDM